MDNNWLVKHVKFLTYALISQQILIIFIIILMLFIENKLK